MGRFCQGTSESRSFAAHAAGLLQQRLSSEGLELALQQALLRSVASDQTLFEEDAALAGESCSSHCPVRTLTGLSSLPI